MRLHIIFAGVNKNKKGNQFLQKGVTLIEMLLVMVVISMIIMMSIGYVQQRNFTMRMNRTTAQMQQILNAGLAYWVANGKWPESLDSLQQSGFLPPKPAQIVSPWGTDYVVMQGPASATVSVPPLPPLLYVYTTVNAGSSTTAAANIIAGSLPMGYATTDTGSDSSPPLLANPCPLDATACQVVTIVNIPGQNLNNANAITYGGVYHNGACVPAPQCPVDYKTGKQMIPEIMVAPVSVSGVNSNCIESGCPIPPVANQPVYPISSFTAYVTTVEPNGGPQPCRSDPQTNTACYADSQGGPQLPTGLYWRVCLSVTTENGPVSWGTDETPQNWGYYATVLAVTRCSIPNEETGSSFNVWAP